MELTFCSYNCCSFKKNVELIRELAAMNIDFIFLQESFVTDNELYILDYMDEKYKSLSVAATYSDKCIVSNSGRPMGGLVCFYKVESHYKVELIFTDKDLMIVRVDSNGLKILFVNVYIRSDLGDPVSLAAYLETLHNIDFILDDIDYDSIYLIGDFNADPFGGRAWNNLKEFIDRNKFCCFDVDKLSNDTFTYISNSYGNCKWLDHVIGRSVDGVNFKSAEVLIDVVGSDHLPLMCSLEIPVLFCVNNNIIPHNNENSQYVDWSSIKTEDLNCISSITAKRVDDFIKSNNLYCETVNCKNELCRHYIDKIYDLLIDSIKDASIDFVKTKVRKDKFNVIPGWNRNVKCEYKKFREKYLNWLLSGKPRDGNLFDEMKIARSQFKRALDFTIKNRNNEVLISIQNNFINKDMNKFWSEVRSRKGGKSCTAIIDGYSESKDIVQVFMNKFLSNGLFTW